MKNRRAATPGAMALNTIMLYEGENRPQATMFRERLDDYINQDSMVRVIDVFIDSLDLSGLGFKTIADFRKDNGTGIKMCL